MKVQKSFIKTMIIILTNRRDNMTDKNMLIKFEEWLEKCPIDYDEHYQTSDDDITTINFHYKNIFNRNAENEQASEDE